MYFALLTVMVVVQIYLLEMLNAPCGFGYRGFCIFMQACSTYKICVLKSFVHIFK